MVMSRERYIAEADHQLCDSAVYQQVSSIMFFDVVEEVMDIFSRLQRSGYILFAPSLLTRHYVTST